jgi:hypothetical protein
LVVEFELDLAKNTLLGMAVFQTYELAVEAMAPAPVFDPNVHTNRRIDPYAQASVGMHGIAGGLGGCMHGVAGIVWDMGSAFSRDGGRPSNDAIGTPNRSRQLRLIAHHAFAHAVLFSSYEAFKRGLLLRFQTASPSIAVVDPFDESQPVEGMAGKEPMTRIEYLGCVALAGGLAGQVQHVVSLYSEQLLMHGIPKWWSVALLPRPLLLAFVPSSIAFVALEYGRREG